MANSVSKILSDDTLSRIIQIESGGNPKAKARTSTASGLFQFINATWLNVVKQYRPDLFTGRTTQQVLDLRFDPNFAIELGTRFEEANAAAIGAGWTDGDLYLAHFLGAGTARKLFHANPASSASAVTGAAAASANPSIIPDKTCAQVRAWAAKRMAESGHTNWIARYWKGTAVAPDTAPVPLPPPKPPVAPAPQPTPASAPKPKTAPKAAGLAAVLAAITAFFTDHPFVIAGSVAVIVIALAVWLVLRTPPKR